MFESGWVTVNFFRNVILVLTKTYDILVKLSGGVASPGHDLGAME